MADRRSSAPDTTRGLPERQQNARDESRIARLDPRGYEDHPTMVGYQDLRQRHVAGLMAMMPDMVRRLGWTAARIRREREDRLRALLRVAKERSPWHRARLRDIDPEGACEDDLQSIPPMTKQDLMEHWNDIVPDDRLPLDVVEAHLDGLT